MLQIPDHQIVTNIISATIILLLLGGFIISFLFIFQRKRQKFKAEKQLLQASFEQTLLQSELEIKEQTLQYISRELHDNLGQVASLIKINLNTLQLNDSAASANKLENTKELMRDLIGELKALSVSLSVDRIAQTGLAKVLENEVERLNKTGIFTATFTRKGELPFLNTDKIIILYRMAQEVLNNMVKHSNAEHINIELIASDDGLTLVIKDDGIGFDVEDRISSGGGAGLLNLQKRSLLINSKLTIQSNSESGTKVSISLPICTIKNV